MTPDLNTPLAAASTNGQVKRVRAHILVTDDRPEVMEMVKKGLGGRYECEFTSSLEQARGKLASGAFDLAICDLQTSREAGLVQVEEIARDHPETAIVLITDVDDPEVTERTFQLGAHGYLVKPFWPGQLLITVKNALRQRHLEQALRAESGAVEEHLHLLSDTAPVPIYIKDADRRYVFANRVAHEMAGVDPGSMIGLTDSDFMSPQQERLAAESDREVLGGGTFEKVETTRIGGHMRTFLNLKFPYLDEGGDPAGITGISTDVTSKRQAEALRNELSAAEANAIESLRVSRQETVERLSRAIETRDLETGIHVARMASIAAYLAAKLGLAYAQVLLIRAAAPMHDVGKIATPDEILHKPGPLTSAERTVMERHTTFGYQILADSNSELLQMGATIALSHHERWDGAGYPLGLEGDRIPVEGRIAAVADVFDALLSNRPYRPAMSVGETVELMLSGRGTYFDPQVLDMLLENVEEVLVLRTGTEQQGDPDFVMPPDKEAFEAVSLSSLNGNAATLVDPAAAGSTRDAAAERRDRAAEGRDIAAQIRDRLLSEGEQDPAGPGEASQDRRDAADDRRQAAHDRELSSRELANEGIDSLTGVMRRRVGLAAIRREMDRAERTGEPFVLAFVDTVGLKLINDTEGHAVGDRVLRDVADCITETLRRYDLVTRVGGDEFVFTLAETSVPQAEARYAEIAKCLARRSNGAGMTVGLAALVKGDSLAQLVDRADQAMITSRRY
jgi:diguanylate cyclase (GGDEF)-like protein/PAS domain S-box-containing protein